MIREFDIIILGCTGYTGSFVAEHACNYYDIIKPSTGINTAEINNEILPATDSWRDDGFASMSPNDKYRYKCCDTIATQLKVGFAGRSKEKILQLRDRLSTTLTRKCAFPDENIVVVDIRNNDELRKVAKRTNVIVTTIGPYLIHGENIVRTCIESGTNYCDITGEVPFASLMERKYHDLATQNKVKVVHFCGFDSVPSDLGTLQVQNYALKHYNKPCNKITMHWDTVYSAISGGTIASLFNFMNAPDMYMHPDAVREKQEDSNSLLNVRRQKNCLFDSFELLKQSAAFRKSTSQKVRDAIHYPQNNIGMVSYNEDVNKYLIQFPMSYVNTNVVMWSNYLLDFKYGDKFEYIEALVPKYSNPFYSYFAGFMMYVTLYSLKFSFMRNLYKRFLPAQGEGDVAKSKVGYFSATVSGYLHNDNKVKRIKLSTGSIEGDPGYHETGKMLFECGAAIHLNKSLCPNIFGSCTPASGIGMVLVDRLIAKKMLFSIKEASS